MKNSKNLATLVQGGLVKKPGVGGLRGEDGKRSYKDCRADRHDSMCGRGTMLLRDPHATPR